MKRFRLLLTLVFASAPAAAYAQKGEQPPTLKTITDFWGKSGEKFQSIKLTWTEREFHAAAVSGEERRVLEIIRERNLRLRNIPPNPETLKEHAHENRVTLWWSNGTWRVERNGFVFPSEERKKFRSEMTDLFDGKRHTQYHTGEGTNPQAIINSEIQRGMFKWLTNGSPFLTHLLDLKRSQADLPLVKCQWTSPSLRNGLRVVEGIATDEKLKRSAVHVLLPELSYALASMTQKEEGKLTYRYEAEFDRSLPLPVLPKRWKQETFIGEEISHSRESFLVSMTVNEPLPSNWQSIDYQPGTSIVDLSVKPSKVTIIPAKPADPKRPNP